MLLALPALWLATAPPRALRLAHCAQVQCGDTQVDEKIEAKINQFYGWVEKHPGKHGQVWPQLCFCLRLGEQSG